jgi:hypothetical protein
MEHTNINWPCENQEKHEVKTHPSDVVFWYDEPYSQSRTYVNCDLKSYAKGSITAGSVREAIESLAKTLSCAEVSQEDDFIEGRFIEKYVYEEVIADPFGKEEIIERTGYVLTALSTTELATLFDRAKQLALAELDFTTDAQSLLIGMRGKPHPSDLVA